MESQKLKLKLAPFFWNILYSSVRIQPLDEKITNNNRPLIFACLHRDMIASIMYVRETKPWLLVSGSDDGQILVSALGGDDFGFIKGATGENGGRALVKLRRTLEAGHNIGLAVDGPKGPFGVIHHGVFQLAKMTGAAIVPLLPEVKPALKFNTWDRTVVPWFFSRINVLVGPLMTIPADADQEYLANQQDQLNNFFKNKAGV